MSAPDLPVAPPDITLLRNQPGIIHKGAFSVDAALVAASHRGGHKGRVYGNATGMLTTNLDEAGEGRSS